MWLAKNKKFQKIGVNENYRPEKDENTSGDVDLKKKKPFAQLFSKLKNEKRDENASVDGFDNTDEAKEAALEKFTYTKTKRVVNAKKTKEKILVPDAPKAPFILLLCSLCLSLAGAFLLNADVVYGISYGAQCAIKAAVSVCVYVIPALVYVLLRKGGLYNVKSCSAGYMPFVFVSLGLVLCTSALQKYLIAYMFSYRVPVGAQQGSLLLTILVGALIPAVCEELLVRGVLQYEFSKYAGGFGGVLFSALAFTLLHFDIQFFGVYFVAGVVLGAVVHVTKSVFPAIIIHFLNNTFSIALSDRLTFVALERIGGTLLIIVLAALCLILLAVMLQMMEKISMKRAVGYLKGDDDNKNHKQEDKGIYKGKADEDLIFFTAHGKATPTKTAKLFFNVLAAVCYGVFLIAILVSG